jgi:hypothetical protein
MSGVFRNIDPPPPHRPASVYPWGGLGLGTEFRSEKIPRNILGMVSVIPRKKVLIPRHSEFRVTANSEARNGTEWNGIPRKNEVLRNLHSFSVSEFIDLHFRENKPKTLVFSHRKLAFWACFCENCVYNFGHWSL